jgi:DNA invertase Pin-like site-specific DNA recombinase
MAVFVRGNQTWVFFIAPVTWRLVRKKPAPKHSDGFLNSSGKGVRYVIGYARVSTTEQNLDLQRDALTRVGCEKIIEGTVSGGTVQRPGLECVHDALRSGDVLAVWRLDRLGCSLKHLIELMAELEAERIGFQSVTESIDTTRHMTSDRGHVVRKVLSPPDTV